MRIALSLEIIKFGKGAEKEARIQFGGARRVSELEQCGESPTHMRRYPSGPEHTFAHNSKVNSISIAIRRNSFPSLPRSSYDFAVFEATRRPAERSSAALCNGPQCQGKFIHKHDFMQSPRLQCLGRECRAMRKRTKTKMQRQEPFLARRTEKCRMNVSKRNIITIIVASS
jgi:hypothetical protein